MVSLCDLTPPQLRLLRALIRYDVVTYEHSRGRDQHVGRLYRLGLIERKIIYVPNPSRPLSRRHGRHRITMRITEKGGDLFRPWKKAAA